jgi:LuxR family transcriptional regulator, maltose regulon positive regulatory protein
LIASMDERLNEERVVEHSHMLCLMAWQDLADSRPRSALEIVDLALDTVARGGVPYFQGISLLVAADVYARTERLEEAGACLDQVLEVISMTGNSMLEWMRQLLMARIVDARGDRDGALATLAAGLQLGREHGYVHFYFWPRDTLSALFDLALASRIETDYVHQLIVHNRMSSPVSGQAVFEWPWPVRVFTLGEFRIELDGRPITFTGKIQKAPLKLLKVLIALGSRNVAEHMVVDALWPDSPGDAGQQALATTLNRLRKLIGPAAILRQDGKLSIQSERVWCDVQALADGLNRTDPDQPTMLASIGALYGGRFLSCDDSIACTAPMRERMHKAVMSTLLDAARGEAAAGRHESAVGLCEQGLQIDDLFEGFYAVAMQSLVVTGRCADAVLQYRRCQRALSTLLGVAPSQATHQVFLSALAGEAVRSR